MSHIISYNQCAVLHGLTFVLKNFKCFLFIQTSVEDADSSPAVNITPRQQPSPAPVMLNIMRRLWSFGRKEKSKSES